MAPSVDRVGFAGPYVIQLEDDRGRPQAPSPAGRGSWSTLPTELDHVDAVRFDEISVAGRRIELGPTDRRPRQRPRRGRTCMTPPPAGLACPRLRDQNQRRGKLLRGLPAAERELCPRAEAASPSACAPTPICPKGTTVTEAPRSPRSPRGRSGARSGRRRSRFRIELDAPRSEQCRGLPTEVDPELPGRVREAAGQPEARHEWVRRLRVQGQQPARSRR